MHKGSSKFEPRGHSGTHAVLAFGLHPKGFVQLARTTLIALLCFSFSLSLHAADDDGTTVKAPPPPTVSEPTAPKPMDRQKSSAAAKAMALGGAAMSNVMCMMMMSQAMGEKDSTNKALMMMAAQQACQQGAELAKSAMENDKGQKLASMEDIPKQSTFKATGMELPTAKSKEESLIGNIPRVTTDDEAPKSDGTIPQLAAPDLTVFEKKSAEPTKTEAPVQDLAYKGENIPAKSFEAKDGITQLDPIKSAAVSFDDKAKAGATPLGPQLSSLGGALGAAATATTTTSSSSKTSEKEEAVVSSGRGKARNVQSEEGSGSGGGGGESSGGGGSGDNSAFEAMLSQILGGPPEAGGVGGGGAGEITSLPTQPDPSKPAPNIFEYATFRLQKLAFEAGRIRSRPFKGAKTLPPTTPPAAVKKTKVAKAP